MSMTREDVLRELELLPVWKLRAQPVAVELVVEVPAEKVQVQQLLVTEITTISEPEKPAISQNIAPIQYQITVSQDKHWAFICMPADRTVINLDAASPACTALTESSGKLLNNILQALHIEKSTKTQVESVADIHAKIIVAMGESVVKALLNTQQSLDNMRGELHPIGDSKLIATYDLAHLLDKPLDKAKVWQDLCLARAYLQSLHPHNLQSQD